MDETGKITYSVEIDVASLKAGAKTAEQAVKTSFDSSAKSVESSTRKMDGSIGNLTKSLAALTASMLILKKTGDFLGESVKSANNFESAMLGLESVATHFIGSSDEAKIAAQQLASDGLMTVGDAATGLKNLLATGFGLPESIRLMQAFKDSAAYGRQGSLAFGEAVRSATDGVKNGNSILVDNSGVTKNLSVMLTEAGYSAQDMGKASSDAGVRAAIFNGILKETVAQTGNAAELTDTAAGAQARLGAQMELLQTKVGQVTNALTNNLIKGLGDFVSANQDSIISVGAGVAAFGAVVLILPKVITGVKAVITTLKAMTIAQAVATGGMSALVAAAGLVAGIAVTTAVDGVISGLEDVGGEASNASTEIKGLTSSIDSASNSTGNLTKKLADLDRQLAKANRDYLENLAEMVKKHQESVEELTQQVEEENANYNAAVKKRLTVFEKAQGEEELEHSKKIKAIQNQINFLAKHQNKNNQQQLSELKFTLAKENAEHQKQTQLRLNEFNAEEDAERQSHEQRLTETQKKLNAEKAFLDKHRDSVLEIRNVMLLDEIQLLKRGHQEKLAELARQRAELVASARTTGTDMGNAQVEAEQKALEASAKKYNDAYNIAGMIARGGSGAPYSASYINELKAQFPQLFKQMKTQKSVIDSLSSYDRKFSSGGFTGAGGVNEPAGIVHRGEYVIPQSLVNQSTGLPKAEALGAITGNSGTTYSITNNISGAIVSSPSDQRRLAEVLGKRMNEIMTQKGFTPVLKGMR